MENENKMIKKEKKGARGVGVSGLLLAIFAFIFTLVSFSWGTCLALVILFSIRYLLPVTCFFWATIGFISFIFIIPAFIVSLVGRIKKSKAGKVGFAFSVISLILALINIVWPLVLSGILFYGLIYLSLIFGGFFKINLL